MDDLTLAAYARQAAALSARHRQRAPVGMQRLILAFFHPGERTADIGCGSGRDTDWLRLQGFAVTGCDASPAMLAEQFGVNGLYGLLRELDERPDAFRSSLRQIACAIQEGPVHGADNHGAWPRSTEFGRKTPRGSGRCGSSEPGWSG